MGFVKSLCYFFSILFFNIKNTSLGHIVASGIKHAQSRKISQLIPLLTYVKANAEWEKSSVILLENSVLIHLNKELFCITSFLFLFSLPFLFLYLPQPLRESRPLHPRYTWRTTASCATGQRAVPSDARGCERNPYRRST